MPTTEQEACEQEARELGTRAVSDLLAAENKGDLAGFPEFLARLAALAERFEKFRGNAAPYAVRACDAWDQILALICSSCSLIDPRLAVATIRIDGDDATYTTDIPDGDYVVFPIAAVPGPFDARALDEDEETDGGSPSDDGDGPAEPEGEES